MELLEKLLYSCVHHHARALLLKAGRSPMLRLREDLWDMDADPLSKVEVKNIGLSVLTDEERERFEADHEWSGIYSVKELGEFDVCIYTACASVCCVFFNRSAPELPPPDEGQSFPDPPIGTGVPVVPLPFIPVIRGKDALSLPEEDD